MDTIKVPPGYRLIFRAWITRDGERVYARDYGLRGFPILVRVRA
jgi:hypothetical protein